MVQFVRLSVIIDHYHGPEDCPPKCRVKTVDTVATSTVGCISVAASLSAQGLNFD